MVCPISQIPITLPILTPCNHLFERSALGAWLTYQNDCPLCRTSLNSKKLFYLPERLYHVLIGKDSKELRNILKLLSLQLLFISLFYKAGKLPYPKCAQGLTTLFFSLFLLSAEKRIPSIKKEQKRSLLESTLLVTSQIVRAIAVYRLFGKKCDPYALLNLIV